MSTPKTPMERAKELYEFTTNKSGQNISEYCIDAYEKGDADRERIMREEASQRFEEWFEFIREKLIEEGNPIDLEDHDNAREGFREAWTAARVDRAELVACILEMAKRFEDNNKYDVEFHGAVQGFIRSHPMRKYEDLITKLKAEKDTL